MKPSPLERDILSLAVASGDLTVAQFADLLGVRPHAVRYALRRLEERGDLSRWVFLDRQRVGLIACNMYFNIPTRRSTAVIEFMKKHPTVQWFGETVGERCFEATLWVTRPGQLAAFFEELGQKTGANLTDRVMAIEGDTWHWGQRCFSEKFARIKPLHFDEPAERFTIDELDARIINARRSPEFWAPTQIARLLGTSATTVSYRIARLQRARIIYDSYLLERRFETVHEGHLLLDVLSRDAASHARILAACQASAAVGGLIRCDGSWDYKLVLFGTAAESLLDGQAQLRRVLDPEVSRITFVFRRSLLKSFAPIQPS